MWRTYSNPDPHGEIMQMKKDVYGDQFLQKANMYTLLYLSMRCLSLRERELVRNWNKLAVIKPVNAIVQTTISSSIPDVLDISPFLVSYHYNRTEIVSIHIANVTTRNVTVHPKVCYVRYNR
jgi:hypothetical protein